MPISSLLIGLGFYAATLVIQFWGHEAMPWKQGQRVDRDITARVDFEYEDRAETDQRRQEARNSAPNVYISNPAPLNTARAELEKLRELAVEHAEAVDQFKQAAAEMGYRLSDSAATALSKYANEKDRSDFQQMVTSLLDRIRAQYIVERPENVGRDGTPKTAILESEDVPAEVPDSQLIYVSDRKEVSETIHETAMTVEKAPPPLRSLFADVVVLAIAGPEDSGVAESKPLWRFSQEATAKKMEEAAERVDEVMISRKAGTTLVEAGTVLGLTELDLLRREHQQYLEDEQHVPELRRKKFLNQLGMAIVILVLVAGLVTYTYHYQPRIIENPTRAFALASLMLLMIAMSRVVERVHYGSGNLPTVTSVFFVVVAAALLAIAYEQRYALGASAILTGLITVSSRGDLWLFLTFIAAMSATIFLLNDVRARSKVIAVGGIAAAVAAIVSAATNMMAGQESLYVILHAAVAGLAALVAGFIVQGVLPHFERIFGIATSMTLLEWCDASKPLLRRLAQETPGTYSHSLVLSQMAEEACEAIGGRGLLARVGALYHDIGKLQKPKYFCENQEANMNRHDRLSPSMSLLIIVGHVKDGIEVARAYGLPRLLHQFIAEHHGTTVVKYFHHRANEAAAKNTRTKGRHSRSVSDTEFRYPGPKPHTKETAILMLCDGAEGSVRALAEPTPGRIETTVHQVVMERLNDGQFDDCDITLRELRLVEQSMVRSLCAIHHGRIRYPKSGSPPPESETLRMEQERMPEHGPSAAPQPAPEVAHHA